MKQKIANWLRSVADKLTGEQTVDIAIAREFNYPIPPEKAHRLAAGVVIEANKTEYQKQCAWVRSSLVAGVEKATYGGIMRWYEDLTPHGGTIQASIRIIKPGPLK